MDVRVSSKNDDGNPKETADDVKKDKVKLKIVTMTL